jgi:hypothetical protein
MESLFVSQKVVVEAPYYPGPSHTHTVEFVLVDDTKSALGSPSALGHPNPGFEERARQGTAGFRGRSSGWGKPSRPAGVDPGQAALLSCPLISSASFAVFVGRLGSPSAQPRLDAA